MVKIKAIPMRFVKSSNLQRVGYNEKNRELHIKFKKSQAVYVYENVQKSIYLNLLKAQSLGTYFSAHIRYKFNFRTL